MADPFYSSVALLLHGDGANNSTTFTDNSPTPKTVTAGGNAKISTAQSKFGGASMLFDGTGDLLTCGAIADWSFMHQAGGQWTWEAWLQPASFAADNTLFSTSNGSTANSGVYCTISATTRTINFQMYRNHSGTPKFNFTSTTPYPNDTTTFHHVAIVVDMNVGDGFIWMFIDGASVGSGGASTSLAPSALAATATMKIGAWSSFADYNGYIDDLRITSLARYTTGFTAPTAAHDDTGPIDIAVDSSISSASSRALRTVAWTSASVGYWFYEDSSFLIGYSKTTDGGATWGAFVSVGVASATAQTFDIYYDRWTPGNSGTNIHIWLIETTFDNVYYRSLDTASDTFGTLTIAGNFSVVLANRYMTISGTVARDGTLWMLWGIDNNNGEKGLGYSTDAGATWTEVADLTFRGHATETFTLWPASNTGDNADIWCVCHSGTANTITVRMWDVSAGAKVDSATIISGVAENINDNTQHAYSCSVRQSDGHLIIVAMTEYDTSTSDLLISDFAGTSSFVALNPVITNADNCYYPQVFIDQTNDTIYVAYQGKSDGSETLGVATHVYYKYSTDGGTTWSAEQLYSSGSGAKYQVWAPVMGLRFQVGWLGVGQAVLWTNNTNSITSFPASTGTWLGGSNRRPLVFACT